MVLVSVIMTSYYREKYIAESIESVLNQSFRDLELIIVDDFSEDKSRDIITKYMAIDNRIKVIFHNENKGIAKSTNDGINIANGKYVAIIDSDDVWDKRKLEKQLQVLNNNNNFIVWTNGVLIDQNSKTIGKSFIELINSQNKKKSGNIFLELLQGNLINKSSIIFQKQNLGNITFNENFKRLDDYQFVVDLANKFEFFFINKPLTSIRQHNSQSLTNIHRSTYILDYIRLYKYFLKKYNQQIPLKTKLYLYNQIINLSTTLGMNIKRFQLYEFKVDPYNFIINLKNESKWVRNALLKDQNRRTLQILYRLYCKSFRSFIVGLAFVFKFKKIQKPVRFWLSFIIFIFFKLIPKVNFPRFFPMK